MLVLWILAEVRRLPRAMQLCHCCFVIDRKTFKNELESGHSQLLVMLKLDVN